jgi:hypothetical protein
MKPDVAMTIINVPCPNCGELSPEPIERIVHNDIIPCSAMRRLNRSFSRRLQIDRQQREKPLAVESWLARRAQIRTRWVMEHPVLGVFFRWHQQPAPQAWLRARILWLLTNRRACF